VSGVAGLFTKRVNATCKTNKEYIVQCMLSSINHRGPDYSSIWSDNNIAIGHVLLNIQDCSNVPRQPFAYNNLIMAFDGEIYNLKQLRSELQTIHKTVNTEGDMEVLVKLFDYYGIDKTLSKIRGSFSIVLYDKEKNKLFLIRDRIGVKPLYMYSSTNEIIFASEIKAILENQNLDYSYNLDSFLLSLISRLWTDPIDTFFSNIKSIEAGTYVEIDMSGYKIHTYYSPSYSNIYTDVDTVINEFSHLFISSINEKMPTKAPFCAFLSGGLDSSLMCKLLNDYTDSPLATYTVYYDDGNHKDLYHANYLADIEMFNQRNILITESDYSLDNIDNVIRAVEEPLLDKVYLPVYLNYKAAKEDRFKVVMNGQGADELWLGYLFRWDIFKYINSEFTPTYLINNYFLPNMVFINKIRPELKDRINEIMSSYLNKYLFNNQHSKDVDILNDISILSQKTILHNLLKQEDKLSMAHSIESRVPFVDDHRLIDLSLSIPGNMKIKDGREKYILRAFGNSILPQKIIEREKYSFPEPLRQYNDRFRNIVKENWGSISSNPIIKEIIAPNFLKNDSYFNDEEIWHLLVFWRFFEVFFK